MIKITTKFEGKMEALQFEKTGGKRECVDFFPYHRHKYYQPNFHQKNVKNLCPTELGSPFGWCVIDKSFRPAGVCRFLRFRFIPFNF